MVSEFFVSRGKLPRNHVAEVTFELRYAHVKRDLAL